jgi:hypothetical protein
VKLFRPPLRRLAILVIVAAVVIGGIVWFFGLPIPQSALVAAAVTALGLTWVAVQESDELQWPQPPIRRAPGARRDLEALSWSMRTRGGVQERSLSRVREAARHRLLFLYGLDLFNEADRESIEQVLAPGVVRTLLTGRSSNLDLNSFIRILGAIEALGSPTERHP